MAALSGTMARRRTRGLQETRSETPNSVQLVWLDSTSPIVHGSSNQKEKKGNIAQAFEELKPTNAANSPTATSLPVESSPTRPSHIQSKAKITKRGRLKSSGHVDQLLERLLGRKRI